MEHPDPALLVKRVPRFDWLPDEIHVQQPYYIKYGAWNRVLFIDWDEETRVGKVSWWVPPQAPVYEYVWSEPEVVTEDELREKLLALCVIARMEGEK